MIRMSSTTYWRMTGDVRRMKFPADRDQGPVPDIGTLKDSGKAAYLAEGKFTNTRLWSRMNG